VSGSGRSIARPGTHGKHVECLLAKSSEHNPPVAAFRTAFIAFGGSRPAASPLSRDRFSLDLLQLAVLFLELTQSLHLRRHQAAVLLAPIVVRGLADSGLATDLTDGCAFLALAQDEGNLRLRKL